MMQVALEGAVSKKAAMASLSQGLQPQVQPHLSEKLFAKTLQSHLSMPLHHTASLRKLWSHILMLREGPQNKPLAFTRNRSPFFPQRHAPAQGDMIPWTISQQYQDPEFPSLSGARVVRIAVHPDMSRAGYGTRALELLRRYYQGDLADLVCGACQAHSIMRGEWQ